MSAPSEPSRILLARQPIFDHQLNVTAYELLYRNDEHAAAVFQDGEQATSEVLLNTYTSVIDRGCSRRLPVFINLTRNMLLRQSIPIHLKQQVVLEVLEDVVIDDALIGAVRAFKEQGFQIALDDFVFSEQHAPLLAWVDIVKIDILAFEHEELQRQVRLLQSYNVMLLAEKIESVEQMRDCVELGFHLFQGFFLSRPQLVKGKKIASNSMAMLRLTQKLQDPDITVKQVEALVMQDPALTYKLLRIINSAAYALANRVKSLDQAIVMLGIEQIKKWVMLIALGSNGNKPEEMTRMLLVRGRMCELLAQAMQRENTNGYFMAGMLSEINALLDIDMDVMLEQISLHNDIKLAISSYRGHMGEVLQATMAYERAEWERLSEYDIEDALYEAAYVESIRWAEQAMSALHA